MADQTPAHEDPQALANAQALWNNFIKFSKIGIVVIAVGLLILAALFIPLSS